MIAVVGGGFAGLALCWHLLHKGYSVELYDPLGIGGGASGVALGLLHPYVGEDGKRNIHASEALLETQKLLDIAQVNSPREVATYEGLLRQANTREIIERFQKHSRDYGDITQIGESLFWIHSGIIVRSQAYLQGLYEACVRQGLYLRQEKVENLAQLSSFGYKKIFLAIGAGIFCFKDIDSSSFRPVKGQVLECVWPKSFPQLKTPVMGKGHIVPFSEGIVQLGSTYERGKEDTIPCPKTALLDLAPKARVLIPGWDRIKVLGCRAGVRVSHIGHYFPSIREIQEDVWQITGLGSRGLLYHAYTAKITVEAALEGRPLPRML